MSQLNDWRIEELTLIKSIQEDQYKLLELQKKIRKEEKKEKNKIRDKKRLGGTCINNEEKLKLIFFDRRNWVTVDKRCWDQYKEQWIERHCINEIEMGNGCIYDVCDSFSESKWSMKLYHFSTMDKQIDVSICDQCFILGEQRDERKVWRYLKYDLPVIVDPMKTEIY